MNQTADGERTYIRFSESIDSSPPPGGVFFTIDGRVGIVWDGVVVEQTGAQWVALKAQRDELLEALKVAQLLICSEWCGAEYHAKPCRNASIAIAKAEQP